MILAIQSRIILNLIQELLSNFEGDKYETRFFIN
jgi:hypothetical protein